MPLTKSQIINAVRNVLSDEDVVEIQKEISRHLGAKTKVLTHLANKDWLTHGIRDLLIRDGLLTGNSADELAQHREAYQSYRKKLPDIMNWLEHVEETQGLDPASRPTLATLCAQAMKGYLLEIGVFRVSTMLSQIDRLPEALDRAFPGYIPSGLLGMVIRVQKPTT